MASRTQHVLTIFIGSPGDLADEREIAASVVAGVNRSVGRPLGWSVELLGWEDTLPGFSRPQARINEDVDACDLFVGLLWERWGQPTGRYSSGFEEEFERARARRLVSGEPEIWLFLKEIEEQRRADPGPQLQQVLTFRERRIAERELLFKEFRDKTDWQAKFFEYLVRHLLETAQPGAEERSTQDSPSAPIAPAGGTRTPHAGSPRPAVEQALAALDAHRAALIRGDGLPPMEGDTTDALAIGRVHLLSASWLSDTRTGRLLGTHEINFLYQQRAKLRLLANERFYLLRTLLDDLQTGVKPGWFWFAQDDSEEIDLLITAAVESETSPEQAARMIEGLARLQYSPLAREVADFLGDLLRRNSAVIVRAALEYVRRLRPIAVLPIVEGLRRDPAIRRDATRVAAALSVGESPTRSLELLLEESDAWSSELESELLKSAEEIDPTITQRALASPNENLRVLALKLLDKHQELTRADVDHAVADPSRAVRGFAVKFALQRGWNLDLEVVKKAGGPQVASSGLAQRLLLASERLGPTQSDLLTEYYNRLPTHELADRMVFSAPDGPAIYAILARREGADGLARARTDLLDAFTRVIESIKGHQLQLVFNALPENSPEFLREKVAAEIDRVFDAAASDPQRLDDFAAAALAVLAESPTVDDLPAARKYVTSSTEPVKRAAVEILAGAGTDADEGLLIQAALEAAPPTAEVAARAALRLTSDRDPVVTRFISSGRGAVVRVALTEASASAVNDLALVALGHEHQTVRSAALEVLTARLDGPALISLLSAYLEAPRRYYDVVAALDAALYRAPLLRTGIERARER